MRSIRQRLIWAVVLIGLTAVVAADDEVVLEAEGIQVTEQEVADRLTQIKLAKGLTGAPPLAMVQQLVVAVLKSKAMARDAEARNLDADPKIAAALADARRQVLAGALLQSAGDAMKVPDLTQAARDQYDANLDKFKAPVRIKASHILFRLSCDCVSCDCLAERAEKGVKAREVSARIQSGESFTQLAIDHSEDPANASVGGALGAWLMREELDPTFADAAFSMKPGEISGVVETRFGFHIIRVDDRAEEEVIPFEKVEARLSEQVTEEYRKRQLAQVSEVYEARAAAGIWNRDVLQRLVEDEGGKAQAVVTEPSSGKAD